LLSRQPLLTKTLHPLESAYYAHNFRLRHALSNPLPEEFWFKEGSLPLKRWRREEWAFVKETYGDAAAGPQPDAGLELEAERPVEEIARDHWEKQDAKRGEQSLERKPEEEVFCLVQEKKGGWSLPTVELKEGEALHQAIENRITGVDGWFDGNGMDTWLVTKKPVAVTQKDNEMVSKGSIVVVLGQLSI
jgi:large subunit ribosomal protein L46